MPCSPNWCLDIEAGGDPDDEDEEVAASAAGAMSSLSSDSEPECSLLRWYSAELSCCGCFCCNRLVLLR